MAPEGPIARQVDRLWDLTFAIAVAVFVFVEGILLFALFRFRQKSEHDRPVQFHHNTRLEIAWTLVPALILAGLAFPTVSTLFDLSRKPNDPLEITVTGHQWWWEYEYPGLEVVTANEMHIPINRPVYLTLRSADVIHSFWVPKLAGKQDVVPGKDLFLTIEAERPGEYRGQCAEFCGLSHANMRLKVFAHTPEDFQAWVADYKAIPPTPVGLAAEGQRLFLEGLCAGCHTVAGTPAQAKVGPNLTGFANRSAFAGDMFENNSENLTRWLTDAPAIKPGSLMPSGKREMGLSDSDIIALVAYLQTLN